MLCSSVVLGPGLVLGSDCVPLPHMHTSPFCFRDMQGVRKSNALGTKEDTGSRFSQVRSAKSEMASPNI